jgi:NADH dehydrogenase/NADH:ubiquinone oxidoreductase subunit G
MHRVTVNGETHEIKDRGTILQALRSLGIEVPTLCHDERLKPQGACRLCVVSVKGWPHPVVSCHTPLTEGMEIETETSPHRDHYTLTPENKVTAARIEKL